jgi:hypothetical protein
MKSGKLPSTDKQARDEVIKGSEKDATQRVVPAAGD